MNTALFDTVDIAYAYAIPAIKNNQFIIYYVYFYAFNLYPLSFYEINDMITSIFSEDFTFFLEEVYSDSAELYNEFLDKKQQYDDANIALPLIDIKRKPVDYPPKDDIKVHPQNPPKDNLKDPL